MSVAEQAVPVREAATVRLARTSRPQLVVLAAQLTAGLTNLVVAIAFARVLPSDQYASVAAFLALYLLIHVPGAALAAAGALDPGRVVAARRRVAGITAVAAVLTAAGSGALGPALGLPVSLTFALASALPGAGLLGLERGLAAGQLRSGTLARSLVAEPAVRLTFGIPLAASIGPLGAALGTVLGGYAGLLVCRHLDPSRPRQIARTRRVLTGDLPVRTRQDAEVVVTAGAPAAGAAVGIAVVFVLLAGLQSIDLLVANHRLGAIDAAQFGALSTLGGAAAFATATIPLVLLPAAARGQSEANATATGLTLVVGLGIAAAGALIARPLLADGFGGEYAAAAGLLGPYLLAMALLGLVRVLVAQRCAAGEARFVLRATVTVLAADVAALLLWGTSVRAVATTTLASTAVLATVLAFPDVVRTPVTRVRTWTPTAPSPTAFGLVGLMVAATVLRTATSRGLWVDEAISVHQAQMPFGDMLRDMQTTDVHPPFHYALLWGTVRLFGTSEPAVRLPSLIAGVALVPALYWTGRVIYDRRTGWVAATLGVFGPFCVWYSQEARMYAQFMLFATLAVGAQVQAIRRGRRTDWLAYALASAAMLWTQYFAFLPLLAQQFGFAAAWWRRRHDRDERRRLALGWLAATALVVVICLPLLEFVRRQFTAYTNRSSGLVPGQAGAGNSTLGANISIYAVGANLIWAVWGYHSDGVMEQIAALWPLVMLAALVALGRGRSGPSTLLLSLVVVPMAALFLIGSVKRDLFELRYFSGAVPAALLLLARLVTATTRRRVALAVAATLTVATMGIGLLDQQTNGANPRLYDFQGALAEVKADARPGDVLLYEPSYLADVIDYYAPGVTARPVGTAVPAGAGAVWVLATDRVVNTEDTAAKVGSVLADLEQTRQLVSTVTRPNVRVWELR
ncbi:MAG: glycosyltransferase family 39 protein [Ilumatobacteraceae bacterium]